MNYLAPPEALDHQPLATLPYLLEQCNHCGKNFSRKSSLSKDMLVVHGASGPSKILQDRYLAKQKDQLSHLLYHLQDKDQLKGSHERTGVEDGFLRELILLLNGISVGGTKHKRERVGSSL